MTPLLLVAAAAAVLLWPKTNAAKTPNPFDQPAAAKAHPSYQTSLASLATVRLRLLQTEQLTSETKSAIDCLTLSLVAGSDQE